MRKGLRCPRRGEQNRFQRACERIRRNPVNLFAYVHDPKFLRRVLRRLCYGPGNGRFVLGERLEWHANNPGGSRSYSSNGKQELGDHVVGLNEAILARAAGIIEFRAGLLTFTNITRQVDDRPVADMLVSMTVNEDLTVNSPRTFDAEEAYRALEVWDRVMTEAPATSEAAAK